MIPMPFDYDRATTLDDAVAKLAAAKGDAKLIAGGHSLVPLMKIRLAEPKMLIDIARIPSPRPRSSSANALSSRTQPHRLATSRCGTGARSAAVWHTQTRLPTTRRPCSPSMPTCTSKDHGAGAR